MQRRILPIVLLCVCAASCLPRQRFNKNCEWTLDSGYALDLHNPDDQRHLVQDAQLAEELAIRYADFQHKERAGYEGHGGYLQNGEVTRACMEKMFAEIEHAHGVTPQQIDDARKARNWRFDLGVLASFAIFYALASGLAYWMLARRVGHFGPRIWLATVVLTSVLSSLAGIQLLEVWSMIAETIRVGNDHLSASRAATSPWMRGQHFGGLLAAGILAAWIVGWIRRPTSDSDPCGSSDIVGSKRVVLR